MNDVWAPELIGWGLTYLAHSSVFGGLVLLTLRATAPSLAVQENGWKLALAGGLLSVGLQAGLGIEPLLGRLELESPAPFTAHGIITRDIELAAEAGQAEPRPEGTPSAPSHGLWQEPPSPALAAPPVVEGVEKPLAAILGRAAVLGWAIASLLLLARLARSEWRLHARLVARRPVTDEVLNARLHELAALARLRRPVRLTSSPQLDVPLARGFARPEICLPERALGELCERQQTAVLAHELAHLARRDLHWQLAARLLETLVPFQPLHRLARRRLAEIAELRCDDWAVRAAGGPLPLARSLATVAGWSLEPQAAAGTFTTAALAARRGDLARRVRRLLDYGGNGAMIIRNRNPALRRGATAFFGVAALALTAWTAPTLSLAPAPPPPPAPAHAPPAPPADPTPASPAPIAQPGVPVPLAATAPVPAATPRPFPAPAVAPAHALPGTPAAPAALAPAAPGWAALPAPALAPTPAARPAEATPPPAALAPAPPAWAIEGTPALPATAVTAVTAPSAAASPRPASPPPAVRGPAAEPAPPGAPAAWTPPPPLLATTEDERLAELLDLERAVALLHEQATLLSGEAIAPPGAESARAATGDELIRALEEALASLRAAGGEPQERETALAALARELTQARREALRGDQESLRDDRREAVAQHSRSREAVAERRARLEAELRERQALLAERASRLDTDRARVERQRLVERTVRERPGAAASSAREEALERQIEALELRQKELRRIIEELRRGRGRLLE